jgi:uncharacterized membrane protein YqaE (UPF0057 family)
MSTANAILLFVLAVLLPPLAVYLRRGLDRMFWVDLALTFVAWLPGVIYAVLLLARPRPAT